MGDVTMTSQTSMTFIPCVLDVGGSIQGNAFLRCPFGRIFFDWDVLFLLGLMTRLLA